jgi:cation transport ATPase
VYGGTLLKGGTIMVEVGKSVDESSLNNIIKMVENAQNSKTSIQSYADKISQIFVPGIISLSVITWLVWIPYSLLVII